MAKTLSPKRKRGKNVAAQEPVEVTESEAKGTVAEFDHAPLLYNEDEDEFVEIKFLSVIHLYRIDDNNEKETLASLKTDDEMRSLTWERVQERYGGGKYLAVGYGRHETYGSAGIVRRISRKWPGPPRFVPGSTGPFQETESGVLGILGADSTVNQVFAQNQQLLMLLMKRMETHEDRMHSIALALASNQRETPVDQLVAAIGSLLKSMEDRATTAIRGHDTLRNEVERLRVAAASKTDKGVLESLAGAIDKDTVIGALDTVKSIVQAVSQKGLPAPMPDPSAAAAAAAQAQMPPPPVSDGQLPGSAG